MDDGTRITVEVEVFLRAARAGEVEKCRELLKGDAKLINSIEAGGFAALHFAAFQGNLQMLEMLAEFHPDYNIENYDGNTPLMLAAKMGRNDAISFLIKSGADVNHPGKGGATAAHHAAGMGHVHTLKHLTGLGAKVIFPTPLETGTLMHWGAHHGDVNVLGALLYEFKVPIDDLDSHGGSALFTTIFTKKPDAVQFFLEHGANPNVQCGGTSPLLLSVEHGCLDDVKNLLAFGADTTAKDHDGKTALEIAQALNRPESVRELTKPVADRAKRLEDATRFKNHGNKVFADGENNKAAKFYTLAISLDHTNHVYFSNRSACWYNCKQYTDALWDAERCLALAPQWPKGYVRKAATLRALCRNDEAKATVEKGLAIDPTNKDLLAIKAELF